MRKIVIIIFLFFILTIHIPNVLESYITKLYRLYQYIGINTTMSLYMSDMTVRKGNKIDNNRFYIDIYRKGMVETLKIEDENFYNIRIPYDWYLENNFYNKKDISNYFCKFYENPYNKIDYIVLRDELDTFRKMRYLCF